MLLVMTLQQSLVVELLYTFCVLEEAIPRFSSYIYIFGLRIAIIFVIFLSYISYNICTSMKKSIIAVEYFNIVSIPFVKFTISSSYQGMSFG